MIIVLTLGRSGSSLLMQTLRALGVNVAGREFDDHEDEIKHDEHRRLNPKGYFEEPDIYYNGPGSAAFQTLVESSAGPSACKMDLRHFADENQLEHWRNAADIITAIYVSFREPSEQAHSEFISTHGQDAPNAREHFMFVTKFLNTYIEAFENFDEALDGPLKVLRPKTSFIDFASAGEPLSYVQRIGRACVIGPSDRQLENAASNIDPDLYRVQKELLSQQELGWSDVLQAQKTYERLKRLETL